jgi:hypothetical protein
LHKLPRTILTLQKRAATLRGLLNKNASEAKLLKAAARLRDAKIQVLRATIGAMPSPIRTPEQIRRIAQLNEEIASLSARAPATVLSDFRIVWFRQNPT